MAEKRQSNLARNSERLIRGVAAEEVAQRIRPGQNGTTNGTTRRVVWRIQGRGCSRDAAALTVLRFAVFHKLNLVSTCLLAYAVQKQTVCAQQQLVVAVNFNFSDQMLPVNPGLIRKTFLGRVVNFA